MLNVLTFDPRKLLDPVSPPLRAQAGWGFKLLIVPGAVALWPLLWRRVRAGGPAAERNAHDRAAARAGR